MPDIQTFLSDPAYLGRYRTPSEFDGHLRHIFEGGAHKVVFTGGLGIGKTFNVVDGLVYLLYTFLSDPDAKAQHGLGPDAEVEILIVGRGKESVSDFVGMLSKRCLLSPELSSVLAHTATTKGLLFRNGVRVVGSSYQTVEKVIVGRNTLAAAFLEYDGSEVGPRGLPKKAGVEHALRRARSRFGERGRVFVEGVKAARGSDLECLMRRALEEEDAYVVDRPFYEVSGDYGEAFCTGEAYMKNWRAIVQGRLDRTREVSVPDALVPVMEADKEGFYRDVVGVPMEDGDDSGM